MEIFKKLLGFGDILHKIQTLYIIMAGERFEIFFSQHQLSAPTDKRVTIHVSGSRLDQVQTNMAGIQNSILNTTTTTTNNNNNNNTIIQLRKVLEI